MIVQDQASSVVWGIPAAVQQAGLANTVLPLAEMSTEIIQRLVVCRSWFNPVAEQRDVQTDAGM